MQRIIEAVRGLPRRAPASAASVLAPVVCAFTLSACASGFVAPTAIAQGPVARLPGWQEDDLALVHVALSRQCAIARPPYPWPALCAELPPRDALKDWIAARFDAWPLERADGEPGLLTGYYEPILRGSRLRENATQVPLYRRPSDMVAGPDGSRLRIAQQQAPAPYPPREEIETDPSLAGTELLWIDDPVEAFFLHIQGSGRIRLRDGSEVRVGFADHNGHPYRAIGRELIERGALAERDVDAQAIKAWLRANPQHARSVMNRNRRFVFFRELPPGAASGPHDGPPGSLGVPLVPTRSVATDPAHVPTGALLFIDSTHPIDGTALRRVVVSQDRGAAITGAVRADLFWGSGDEAGRLAGRTKQPARIWLLWPRGSAPPGR